MNEIAQNELLRARIKRLQIVNNTLLSEKLRLENRVAELELLIHQHESKDKHYPQHDSLARHDF